MAWSGLRSDLRAFFGVDDVTYHLSRLESTMARITDALNRLVSQQQDASAAQLVSFQNLQTGVDRLKAAVERLQAQVDDPELTDEAQAALDQISTGFDTMIRDAQRADDGVEEPAEVPAEGETPVEGEQPVVDEPGTDTPPPAEGDSTTTR